MSLREWLILLGAVIVVGIVLDGIRRMHRARKDSQEISRGMGADQLEDSPLESGNSELPGGGARIVDRLGGKTQARVKAAGRTVRSNSRERRRDREEPGEEGLSADDLDDQLPEDFSLHADVREDADQAWSAEVAQESDAERAPKLERELKQELEQEPHEEQAPESAPRSRQAAVAPAEGQIPTLKAATSQRRHTGKTPERGRDQGRRAASTGRPVARKTQSQNQHLGRQQPAKPDPRAASAKRPLAGANRPPAKEVFVFNVDCKSPEGFRGGDLKRLFEACGLEHGDLGIYHRHENDDTGTPVQFSVANAVEPGTFSPRDMDQLTTPAVSFFMSLPGPTDSLQAYDFMVETAQCVVRNLGGDLKDERRSVVTAQTIEYGRQRVREFERKRRSVKA